MYNTYYIILCNILYILYYVIKIVVGGYQRVSATLNNKIHVHILYEIKISEIVPEILFFYYLDG